MNSICEVDINHMIKLAFNLTSDLARTLHTRAVSDDKYTFVYAAPIRSLTLHRIEGHDGTYIFFFSKHHKISGGPF